MEVEEGEEICLYLRNPAGECPRDIVANSEPATVMGKHRSSLIISEFRAASGIHTPPRLPQKKPFAYPPPCKKGIYATLYTLPATKNDRLV